ncbi:MAG: lysylphosphatidylglycerol synthase domain-containing protein [Vicinamibacterales bacterium]
MTHAVHFSRHRWIIPAVGVALLAILFAQIGPRQILALLSVLGLNILAIMAIFACHECVRAVAIGLCFPPDAPRPPMRQRLRARFLGELAGTLTRMGPFVAEPSRAWIMTGRGLSGTHVYAAAAGEFIFNGCMSSVVTIAAILLTSSAWAVNWPIRILSLALLSLSAVHVTSVVVALTFRLRAISAVADAVRALPLVGNRLRPDPVQVRQVEDAVFGALVDRPRTLGLVVCLELLAQAILVFEVFWTLQSMGVPVSMRSALLIHALGQGVGLIQFVGVTEAGYAVLFKWLGMTAAVGFATSLVKTLRSLATSALGLLLLTQTERMWLVPRTAPEGSSDT